MLFFIDIGNTRIKFTADTTAFAPADIGIADGGVHGAAKASQRLLAPLFDALLRQHAKRLLITVGRSTAAQSCLTLIKQFAEQQQIRLETVSVNPDMLSINYQDVSQFGADRFLHLLAARRRLGDNFCVVSCGTAITLDFYSNGHIGGMIAPGLGMSKQLLAQRTGLYEIAKPVSLLGHDTASSIGAGLYFGYKNLVFGSIAEVEKSLNSSLQLVFSGGDAKVLAAEHQVIPELLFEGMRIYDHY